MGRYSTLAALLVSFLAVFSFLVYFSESRAREVGGGNPSHRSLLKIATTTSLDASGLLDFLKAEFESEHPGIEVVWIAAGTGQAIEIAKRGDVDLVITHDRELEDEFISEGYGVHGVTFACNEYYIVGPREDPAGVSSAASSVDAFTRIFYSGESGKAFFVSRGDRSGTHMRELSLWYRAGLNPAGKAWYRETGQGMAQTLLVADQLGAYTLCDSATFLSFRGRVSLEVLFKGDPELKNFYRVILVNPEKFPWVNYEAAREFVKFIVSQKGQRMISEYRKGGVQLFEGCFGARSVLEAGGVYEQEQVNYWRGLNG